MTLIPCEECGAGISDRAYICPQCGGKNMQYKSLSPYFYDENGDIKRLKLFFFQVVFGVLGIICTFFLISFIFLLEE
jgi:hypothetical protein